MVFFQTIWSVITSFFGLILPLGRGAGAVVRSPAMRWVIHGLALLGVLVVLGVLNAVLRIANQIPLPGNTGSLGWFIRHLWLPLLFLLVYALAWLGWWLWRLWMEEEGPSSYPDIDAAWEEAVRTLAQNNIQVTDLPLFFVLGRTEGPDEAEPGERGRKAEESLFHQAAQLTLAVKQCPNTADAPLHVYATREAIYVTCAGASLLGRQAAILAGEVQATVGDQTEQGGDNIDVTLAPNKIGQPARDMIGIVSRAEREGATEEDRRALRRLMRKEQGVSLFKDRVQVADLTGRLRHLCRLIVRDRQPYCPVNGVLVLVPLAATDSDEDAQETARTLASDLQTMRTTLKVDCPLFTLLSDVETAPGFREFIAKQAPSDRQRRVGQRFPMGLELRGQPLADTIDTAVRWLCDNVLREWVYRLFRVEAPGREDTATATAINSRLFLLLGELRERGVRLSRVLTGGLLAGGEGPIRFGGCYLAATGTDASQQAFVAGVFRRLPEAQNNVAWTPEARAEDARQSRSATIAYAVLAGLGLLVVGAAGLSLLGRSGSQH